MSSLSVRTLTDQEVLDVAGEAFPTANVLNRCAIGDRDPLSLNHDGSLDLRIQHQSPGADRECNWLPAPAGACNVLLRLLRTEGDGDRPTMGAAAGAASGLTLGAGPET